MRAWQRLFAEGALGPRVTFEDRDEVFAKGAAADAAWFLAEGAVEILQPGQDGGSVVVKLLVAPTLFGLIEALGDERETLESVRALGDITCARMERRRLHEIVAREGEATVECLRDVCRAFCVAARFEPSRLSSVDALLANALLAYVDACGEPWDGGVRLRVKRTQADLAQAIGASERSVNKLLSSWKSEGVIDKNDARYIVHQRAVLEELAGELAGSLVHRW